MKHRKLRIAWSVAWVPGLITLFGCEPTQQPLTKAPAVATSHPAVEGDEPTVSVPLASVSTTSEQEGMPRVRNTAAGPFGHDLHEMWQSGAGSSNIYLVDARDLAEAVNASARVVIGGYTADRDVTLNMPDPPRGNYWLVVFLGVRGSSPTNWLVDAVSIRGRKLRFSYHQQRSGAESKDSHLYLYWTPIGALESATYELELFDTGLNATTLMRRVEVGSPR